MQGFSHFIPTDKKIEYINGLLRVGFDTLDFGSFVSPKIIPQMRDTETVLQNLDRSGTRTKLLAIVANNQGAEAAVSHGAVNYLGFPFSISETFQDTGKELVIYISMGFGNHYGDPWNTDVVDEWVDKMA
eukprot:gene48406-64941_t